MTNHPTTASHTSQMLILFTALLICHACLPLPTLRQAPPASDADFRDDDPPPVNLAQPANANEGATPAPEGSRPPSPQPTTDPFTPGLFKTIRTSTPFKPSFEFKLTDELRAGTSPSVETSIYQTAKEIELREARMTWENCNFRYDLTKVGAVIGTVTMDVGTPPKATLTGPITVTDTDGQSRVTVSAKASNAAATAYVADMRIKQVQGHLSIVSIANFTRANDSDNIYLTERSARITQRLNPGYLLLPRNPGNMRIRTLLYGETDPKENQTPLIVIQNSYPINE